MWSTENDRGKLGQSKSDLKLQRAELLLMYPRPQHAITSHAEATSAFTPPVAASRESADGLRLSPFAVLHVFRHRSCPAWRATDDTREVMEDAMDWMMCRHSVSALGCPERQKLRVSYGKRRRKQTIPAGYRRLWRS